MTDGQVNIRGKVYDTVALRVQKFREKHGDKYGIITEIVSLDDDRVVVFAKIVGDKGIIATGHAEEYRTASQINKTSALENCETSAIGRALAAFGMAGTEFASADEVAQSIHQQSAPKPASRPSVGTKTDDTPATKRKLATEAQVKLMLARSRDISGLSDRQEIYDWFLDQTGYMPNEIHIDEVDDVLKVLAS